jgi:hypothetical protein
MQHEQLYAEVRTLAEGRPFHVNRGLRDYGDGTRETWTLRVFSRSGAVVIGDACKSDPLAALEALRKQLGESWKVSA